MTTYVTLKIVTKQWEEGGEEVAVHLRLLKTCVASAKNNILVVPV